MATRKFVISPKSMRYSKAPLIGFSTGAIARGEWQRGVDEIRRIGLRAIELSALRYHEFAPLVSTLGMFDQSVFDYVSLHLPSKYDAQHEKAVIALAEGLISRRWPLILHPDAVADWGAWRSFGNLICVENMDKRKHVGRTVEDLAEIFKQLPEATLCFDFGHARQVDGTMTEGARILTAFSHRLQQIHFSDVDTSNSHRALNEPALTAFHELLHLIDPKVPVILETPVYDGGMREQLELTHAFFSGTRAVVCA